MYKSMRKERTHSIGLRELANAIVRFFEWLWQFQEFPGRKWRTSHSASKGQVKGSKELKSSQLFFSPWENNRPSTPASHFQACEGQDGDCVHSALVTVNRLFEQLLWLLWWADWLYRQARTADVIYLYLNKTFDMVSHDVFIYKLERSGLDG